VSGQGERADGASEGTGPEPAAPWIVLEGASIGAVGGLLLTAQNLFDVLIDDRIEGVSVPTIHRFLATDYRSEVVRAVFELAALSVIVGTLVGIAAALTWQLRRRWCGGPRVSVWNRWLSLIGLGGCMLGWVYLHDIAARPALYQTALYARGGVRAWIQVVVADGLGKTGIVLLGLTLVGAFWSWPARNLSNVSGRLARLVAPILTFGAVLWFVELATGCTSGSGRKVAHGHPNVLLLAADSLRPDRLDAERAPQIKKLLDGATSFERAYTPLARTFPAWVSIATGRYPQHHGIRHMFPRWEARERDFDTLGKHFAEAGYHTAVVGDFAADIFRRINLGYQRVNTPTFTMRELVREHLLKNDPWLLAWVRGRLMRWLVPIVVEMHEATDPQAVTEDAIHEIDAAKDKPFFVTVFYSTTHFPYASPGPHHRRFRVPEYAGPFRFAKADTLDASEVISPADIAQVRSLYDGAVYATDEAVGELLAALERRGLREDTIVVVTADHGEGLYEHGRAQGHGDHLHGDEALRVPLVISDPKRPGARRHTQPVSLVDLAPTLLDLAQLSPLMSADGRSLASSLGGGEPEPKAVYSETGLWFTEAIAEVPLSQRIAYPDLTRITEVDRKHLDQVVIRERYESLTTAVKHRMLQSGDWRLLYLPTRAGPKFELCDLKLDPGCEKDCSDANPARLNELKAQFWQFIADDPAVLRQGDVLLPRSEAKARMSDKVLP
jgi:arylsulfatase A-like enzyme